MNAREIAYQRDARGVCIICEDDKSQRRRGLCIKHYTRYTTSRKELPEDQRDAYDEYLVSKGLLMSSQQGRRVDPNDNEFALAMQDFLTDQATADTPASRRGKRSSQQLAKHMAGEAADEQAEKPPKKGRAGGRKKS